MKTTVILNYLYKPKHLPFANSFFFSLVINSKLAKNNQHFFLNPTEISYLVDFQT